MSANELAGYSDAFIQSQIDYYSKHLLSGNHADRLLIHGALNTYEIEQRRRAALPKTD